MGTGKYVLLALVIVAIFALNAYSVFSGNLAVALMLIILTFASLVLNIALIVRKKAQTAVFTLAVQTSISLISAWSLIVEFSSSPHLRGALIFQDAISPLILLVVLIAMSGSFKMLLERR